MRTQECVVLEDNASRGLATPMLERTVEGARAWTRDSISPKDWALTFPPEALREIAEMVAALRSDPLPTLMLSPALFRLDACRAVMQKARAILQDGIGLCVVGHLPLDDLSLEEAKAVYWVLGQCVERLVAQKWDGTMIYDVMDTGRAFGYGVRASWTNVDLYFHTDNAFAVALPTYVSLLCLNPAKKGGVSRFCSLYTVHNRMRERYPRLLQRLYQPFYFDRQAEHAPGAPKVSIVPALSWDGRRLRARLSTRLVRKGYELMDEPIDPVGGEALDALDEVMQDDDLWVEFVIQRGELQYLNNLEFGHYRSEFEDHDDPALKRHMIRLWYRAEGRPSYDG